MKIPVQLNLFYEFWGTRSCVTEDSVLLAYAIALIRTSLQDVSTNVRTLLWPDHTYPRRTESPRWRRATSVVLSALFRDVMPCILAKMYQPFGETFCPSPSGYSKMDALRLFETSAASDYTTRHTLQDVILRMPLDELHEGSFAIKDTANCPELPLAIKWVFSDSWIRTGGRGSEGCCIVSHATTWSTHPLVVTASRCHNFHPYKGVRTVTGLRVGR
jgi:hypothetical protein